jgi:hypothetical protein
VVRRKSFANPALGARVLAWLPLIYGMATSSKWRLYFLSFVSNFRGWRAAREEISHRRAHGGVAKSPFYNKAAIIDRQALQRIIGASDAYRG